MNELFASDVYGREGKRPTLGADSVILVKSPTAASGWKVLLIERGHEPYKGKWALPGGFMEWGESCEQAAARELEEETSLKNVELKQLGVFSKPGRDPRGTIVSVAFWGVVDERAATQRAAVTTQPGLNGSTLNGLLHWLLTMATFWPPRAAWCSPISSKPQNTLFIIPGAW
ncbi:MAG: NUDIX hydrolase [Candidatus Gracilibacteria bacterium]